MEQNLFNTFSVDSWVAGAKQKEAKKETKKKQVRLLRTFVQKKQTKRTSKNLENATMDQIIRMLSIKEANPDVRDDDLDSSVSDEDGILDEDIFVELETNGSVRSTAMQNQNLSRNSMSSRTSSSSSEDDRAGSGRKGWKHNQRPSPGNRYTGSQEDAGRRSSWTAEAGGGGVRRRSLSGYSTASGQRQRSYSMADRR